MQKKKKKKPQKTSSICNFTSLLSPQVQSTCFNVLPLLVWNYAVWPDPWASSSSAEVLSTDRCRIQDMDSRRPIAGTSNTVIRVVALAPWATAGAL
jgi:hypothetical protein